MEVLSKNSKLQVLLSELHQWGMHNWSNDNFFQKKFIYLLSNLHTQHGVRTHNCEIKVTGFSVWASQVPWQLLLTWYLRLISFFSHLEWMLFSINWYNGPPVTITLTPILLHSCLKKNINIILPNFCKKWLYVFFFFWPLFPCGGTILILKGT